MTKSPKQRTRPTTAIGKSLDVYYRDRARTARMDRLNATLIGEDALVFDIGAHVGDRADSFARLGASVVAIEPQPRVFRALRLILGRRDGVTLRNVAVGAKEGQATLHINSANPTVSTASTDLIAAADAAPTWQGQVWDSTTTVPMTTLDMLIAEFGVPDFVKIDVEGFELEVFKGLTKPLPAFSFEFTTIQREMALACVVHIATLGEYDFNYSLGEDHQLACRDWTTADGIRSILLALPDKANSGDIFVRVRR